MIGRFYWVVKQVARKNLLQLLLTCVLAFLCGVFLTDLFLCSYAQKEHSRPLRQQFNDLHFLYLPFYEDYRLSHKPDEDVQKLIDLLKKDERIINIDFIQDIYPLTDSHGRSLRALAFSDLLMKRLALNETPEIGELQVWVDARLQEVVKPGDKYLIKEPGGEQLPALVSGHLSEKNKLVSTAVYNPSDPKITDLIVDYETNELYTLVLSNRSAGTYLSNFNTSIQKVLFLKLSPGLTTGELNKMYHEFEEKGIGRFFSFHTLLDNQNRADWIERVDFLRVSILFLFLFFLSVIGFMIAMMQKSAASIAVFSLLGLSRQAIYTQFICFCLPLMMLFSGLGVWLAPNVGSDFPFFTYQAQFGPGNLLPPFIISLLFLFASYLSWKIPEQTELSTTLRRAYHELN